MACQILSLHPSKGGQVVTRFRLQIRQTASPPAEGHGALDRQKRRGIGLLVIGLALCRPVLQMQVWIIDDQSLGTSGGDQAVVGGEERQWGESQKLQYSIGRQS